MIDTFFHVTLRNGKREQPPNEHEKALIRERGDGIAAELWLRGFDEEQILALLTESEDN